MAMASGMAFANPLAASGFSSQRPLSAVDVACRRYQHQQQPAGAPKDRHARSSLTAQRSGHPSEAKRLTGASSEAFASRVVGSIIGAASFYAASISKRRRRPSASQPITSVAAASGTEDASALGITNPADARAVAKRLNAAASSLQFWGYVAETSYTWLGMISLAVVGFNAYARGPSARNSSSIMGLATVGLSVACAFVGWLQSRMCRHEGRRCKDGAAAMDPQGATPPDMKLLPALGSLESQLAARQRTAWLGMLFAVLGLEGMVGLLVAKVLSSSNGFIAASGFNLDVFTLLSVGNVALSHVIGSGAVSAQRASLPPTRVGGSDKYRGWDR